MANQQLVKLVAGLMTTLNDSILPSCSRELTQPELYLLCVCLNGLRTDISSGSAPLDLPAQNEKDANANFAWLAGGSKLACGLPIKPKYPSSSIESSRFLYAVNLLTDRMASF